MELEVRLYLCVFTDGQRKLSISAATLSQVSNCLLGVLPCEAKNSAFLGSGTRQFEGTMHVSLRLQMAFFFKFITLCLGKT